MANPVAYKAKTSKLRATISATLTTIPGVVNLKINPGENQTFENADLESDYVAPAAAGLRGEGSWSADIISDPLDAAQQFMQAAYNAATEVIGTVVLGSTGVILSCKYIVTKWEIDASRGAGLMISAEGKFTEILLLNEIDP